MGCEDPLNGVRERIDAIDQEILRLISERATCATSKGSWKAGPTTGAFRNAWQGSCTAACTICGTSP